jgi:tetratricopeptide (TPR) repeat protein
LHTLAEIKRTSALAAKNDLEKGKIRNEARAILKPLLGEGRDDHYARHTFVKLAIDELRDELVSEQATEASIDARVRGVEEVLQKGFQRNPDDEYLLVAESDYSQLLKDDERSVKALRRAFAANSRDSFIAGRLARICEAQGDMEEARRVLYVALEANGGDQRLHFQFAEVLRREGGAGQDTLLYHYRRAFTKWDCNYEAQFWFARYTFESEDGNVQAESKETFRRLRNSPLAYKMRHTVRDVIGQKDVRQEFRGSITRLDYSSGWIRRDRVGDDLFIHKNAIEEEIWRKLGVTVRVRFGIGFSMNGALAIDINVLN